MSDFMNYTGKATLYLPPLDLDGYRKVEVTFYELRIENNKWITVNYKQANRRKLISINIPYTGFVILEGAEHPEVENQYRITSTVKAALFHGFSEEWVVNFLSFINAYITSNKPNVLFDGRNFSSLIEIESKQSGGIIAKDEIFTEESTLLDQTIIEEALFEGVMHEVTTNSYERNQDARRKCLEHYGLSCVVCNLNFGERYGDLVRNFIHVHHIVPISYIKDEYQVDPVKDLRPVCPNCHAVIHSQNPPLTIDEVRDMLRR